MNIQFSNANTPRWRDAVVKSSLPAKLEKLREISENLWWVWNYEAKDIFESIDPTLWENTKNNPVLLLKSLSYDRLMEVSEDKSILDRIESVYKKFKEYINTPYDKTKPSVAYFSMEYGLVNILKI
ncbi:MAG: DUF3417 domain-containing protein, partial [Bacteroidales bacterium]